MILHFLVFSQELVVLLGCFGSLSCCLVWVFFGLTFTSSILWLTIEFMVAFLMVSRANPAAANHTRPWHFHHSLVCMSCFPWLVIICVLTTVRGTVLVESTKSKLQFLYTSPFICVCGRICVTHLAHLFQVFSCHSDALVFYVQTGVPANSGARVFFLYVYP